jgi:two-component system phosphate regulon sensor histidine kinase PhoR
LAQATARRDALNVALLYLFIIFGGLFLLLTARSNIKNFRAIRLEIDSERSELEKARQQVTQLQNLDAAKNALISNVNHELRTPLTSIIGYTELLQRDISQSQNVEQGHYLEVLQRNSQTLLNLVESLLSLSKFDSGVGKLPNEEIFLKPTIENAIFTLQPALEKSAIRCEIRTENDLSIRGDVGQINQLLINLIANAIKFSPPGGVIEIELNKITGVGNKNAAQIKIVDRGIGIAQSELDSIFDRFYRGQNIDADKYQGTGLGLAIVKQVVDHHHGTIHVQSVLGEGSTFIISIPLFSEETVDA